MASRPNSRTKQRIYRNLLSRDGIMCAHCGLPMDLTHRDRPTGMTIEHIVPRAHGGSNQLTNLCLMHKRCNNELGESISVQVKEYRKWKHLQLSLWDEVCNVKRDDVGNPGNSRRGDLSVGLGLRDHPF